MALWVLVADDPDEAEDDGADEADAADLELDCCKELVLSLNR